MRLHPAVTILLASCPCAARALAGSAQRRLSSLPAPKPVITPQLVLTGRPASLELMPEETQRNVQSALDMNPELRPRWLGDAACRRFIRANFGDGLLATYDGEQRGSFRGDICRAAVLQREGGFYMDLDVQPRVPFSQMVDNTTTFMAAFSFEGAILNALLAVEPGSEVMQAVLDRIEGWYAGNVANPDADGTKDSDLGPVTMLRGLRAVVQRDCPSAGLSDRHQWACGPHHVIRLYSEHRLQCFGPRATEECPEERRFSKFEGLRFGIFEPGPEGRLVAWSRFAGCDTWGCRSGGLDKSKALTERRHRPLMSSERP